VMQASSRAACSRATCGECLNAPAEGAGPLRPGHGGLIENLHLLAVHDLAGLKRAARVSDETSAT